MRESILFTLLPLVSAMHAAAQPGPPAWRGFAGDAQHTAAAPAPGQPLRHLHWQMQIDLEPVLTDGQLLTHYASPMITGANTVLVPVKQQSDGGFALEAHRGATGTLLWHTDTDYLLPPHVWIPSLPAYLTDDGTLYFAGAGGTIFLRDNSDSAAGATRQVAFYGIGLYRANPAALQKTVFVSTPITADRAGNLFFGFRVTGANPAKLASGIARIGADGRGSWISATAAAAGDPVAVRVAANCAPGLSADGQTLYVAVGNGKASDLVGLDATTLQPRFRASLTDPSTGKPALVQDNATASPTIGPECDVYFGVLEDAPPAHNHRGWLLHFDATLATTKTPGSFGWDATASIVPSGLLPSYAGGSAYLILIKDNNYLHLGRKGRGENRLSVFDPNAAEQDRYSAASVMRTVQSVLDPIVYPGAAGAVYEWCINSAVVDVATGSVIAHAEDGHAYRWDLATNALTESFLLNAPRPESYTPTLIGPDGTIYAINNATLYAIGR